MDTGRWKGLNGGKGGNGGNGCMAGVNGIAGVASTNVGTTCTNISGSESTALPTDGSFGTKGLGGNAGYIYNHSWDHGTYRGSKGSDGKDGTII